jgi:hypothetical protein
MQLPDDIIRIIREFSKPLTRPDWRTLSLFAQSTLYKDLYDVLYFSYKFKLKPLYKRSFNHLRQTEWGQMYIYIRTWGIQEAAGHFKISVTDLYKIKGMKYAQEYYVCEYYFYENNV